MKAVYVYAVLWLLLGVAHLILGQWGQVTTCTAAATILATIGGARL